MTLEGAAQLPPIFVGESARHGGRPLSEAIVPAARRPGLAGATASNGFMRFGAPSRIPTATVLQLSDAPPVLLELVDEEERLRAFLPVLAGTLRAGLVTLERQDAIRYRSYVPYTIFRP
ncbi:DUF190 domain-containing protein, partial [Thermus scotoductus]